MTLPRSTHHTEVTLLAISVSGPTATTDMCTTIPDAPSVASQRAVTNGLTSASASRSSKGLKAVRTAVQLRSGARGDGARGKPLPT